MSSLKILRESLLLTILIILTLSSETEGSPFYPDIRESAEIGVEGGSIMAEDPETGLSAGIFFPEGALQEKTTITLLLHGTRQSGVLGKTHSNGISVLPKDLLLLEKARLEIYNPPVDVTKGMILYHIVNDQFIIPLGSLEQHIDDGYIEGTFYITGKFSLGTPTAAEVSAQSKKLVAYNPSRPLAYAGEDTDKRLLLTAELDEIYSFPSDGGPSIIIPYIYTPEPYCISSVNDDCLQWQKAVTKIEATMTWIEFHQRNGNTSAENAEKQNAGRALQEAIDSYLNKSSPSNRCGSYIKAAAKYLEAATLLGMNLGDESPIAQHFNRLVDECSFVFAVETHEWINNPREKHDDEATSEEKSNLYGTLNCHIPWNEFIATGNQKIRGNGTMNLHYENHWVGYEKEDHTITDGSWRSDKIEGGVSVYDDGHGQLQSTAHITIYWNQKVTTHIYGKRGKDKPYDETGSDSKTYEENKSFPLRNFEEKIGNTRSGRSMRVIILKQPGDGRDDPNDCF